MRAAPSAGSGDTQPIDTAKVAAQLEALRADMDRGEALLQHVLLSDEQVMSRIQGAQADLLRQIQIAEKSQANVSRFKSVWVNEPGEELDAKL